MKIFILAEKPSVAKSFAQALNARYEKGYYKNDTYVISNCIGHLYRTYFPEEYDPKYKFWSKDDLPIIPNEFLYKANIETKKQAELIEYLLGKYSYDKIIIATDAGREGQLIASIVLKMSGITDKDNIYRFWSSSALTDETIKEELKNIKPINEYSKIEAQGYYRSYADWLVGINISRLVTLLSGNLMHCGRVKLAVLYELYNRENKIKNFVSEPYFEVIAFLNDGVNKIKAKMYKVENEKVNSKFKTIDIDKNKFLHKIFTVRNKDTKTIDVMSEKLFNITALQKKAFAKFGLSPDQTLQIAQTLYEQYKCLSYPRTPSRVMGSGDLPLLEKIFKKFSSLRVDYVQQIDKSLFNVNNTRVFNNKLLEDHHALIPLDEIPENAKDIEKKVFELVVKNFFCVFSKPYRYEATTVYLTCEDKNFIAKGINILDLGFKKIENDEEVKEKLENNFSKVNFEHLNCVDIKTLEKKTEPEPMYRFDTILSFMENPKKDNVEKKLVGLGTPATRASILNELIKGQYIVEEKKYLRVQDRGKLLINYILSNDVLKPLIDVETTMKWEESLANDSESFYKNIKDFVKTACDKTKITMTKPKSIGKCPLCHSEIYEGKSNWYCSNYKNGCKFSIWKEISGAKLNITDFKNLILGKETDEKKCKSKDGKPYQCKFKLDEKGFVKFIFNKIKKKTKVF